tara:strand:- start:630 stop:935 length:306 start_codon:yes stop_codon:yes gene_type:complete
MDNTLIQSRSDTDPVLKEESRQQWENQFNPDGVNCEEPGSGCSYSKKTNTYKGAVVKPYEEALANHQNFTANSSHSQGVNGNAFDTTLTRYSPNVAQSINF